MEGLRDIKSLMEVPDYSLWYLCATVVGVFIVLVVLFFLLKKVFAKTQNSKKIYLQKLKNLDLKNSKKSAYMITEASSFVCDTPSKSNVYAELESKLQRYKYKKWVEPFDDSTLQAIKHFIEVIDE